MCPSSRAVARPEVVLRFGAMPTSKPLMQYLAGLREARHVVVDVAGGWRDADASGSTFVQADPGAFCARWAPPSPAVVRPSPPGWRTTRCAGPRRRRTRTGSTCGSARIARRRGALRDALDAFDEPFEGRAPAELASALPAGATLVVGNSMPARDMDAFFPALPRDVRVVGTRGASGIDGVVSTAVGAAAARGGPVALLIGDLSFFHDMNGLWALKRHGLSLTVLLVNNDGGGIFHFLPQAEMAADQFEQWFGTPHGLEFRGVVEMFGGRFEAVEGHRGWDAQLRTALASKGLTVLELRTDRERNVVLHRQVWAHVSAAVRTAVEESRRAGVVS